MAVGQLGGRGSVVQGRGGGGGGRHRVGQGGEMSRRAPQELRAQPVGHPAALRHRRDAAAAAAHGPQVGVLAATGKAISRTGWQRLQGLLAAPSAHNTAPEPGLFAGDREMLQAVPGHCERGRTPKQDVYMAPPQKTKLPYFPTDKGLDKSGGRNAFLEVSQFQFYWFYLLNNSVQKLKLRKLCNFLNMYPGDQTEKRSARRTSLLR